MRGIITRALRASIKRGMTLNVVRRYLKIKHKITTTVDVLADRVKKPKKNKQMSTSNEELLQENVQLLTNILADQTTTLKALISASEILNERIKKLEISSAIRDAVNTANNE